MSTSDANETDARAEAEVGAEAAAGAGPEPVRQGLWQSAVDEFVERTRALASLVGTVGNGALSVAPAAVPASVNRMLGSLQHLVDQAPPITAEFGLLLDDLRAKRLLLQALQAELAVFEAQLEILERSLAPLATWSQQWSRMRHALLDTMQSAGQSAGQSPGQSPEQSPEQSAG